MSALPSTPQGSRRGNPGHGETDQGLGVSVEGSVQPLRHVVGGRGTPTECPTTREEDLGWKVGSDMARPSEPGPSRA